MKNDDDRLAKAVENSKFHISQMHADVKKNGFISSKSEWNWELRSGGACEDKKRKID